MGVAGSEVVEGGDINAALSVMGAGAIVAASEVLGERGAAGRSAKAPEGPAGGLSMTPSNSTCRRATSVRTSRMYLICSASDGIEGPGRDPTIKGSLVELASSSSSSRSHGRSLALQDCVEGPGTPFYAGGSVIEFVS
ncbi:hypothetical protein B9Z19DRAFT_1100686 [Tuber borchii]|uniref:Uncharacterized protein n=1 Tax=Tuber borchii TaxID=42251 RepID=A0A2T6ZW54_TUBBO|nr:hypothetical protein B9Z19DRAFT_1100686 [Tuber borchii]